MAPLAAPPVNDVILRIRDVLARVRLGRTTLYRLIAARQFPPPLKLGPAAIGWRQSDIDRWIADRVNPTEAARR